MDPQSHHPPLRSHATRWSSCMGGGEPVERLALAKVQNSSRITCTPACKKKLDGVAWWVVNGIATAFFTSLERCACIHIGTKDEPEDPSLLPLIGDRGMLQQDTGAEDQKKVEVEASTAASVDVKLEQLQ
ncbi:hypothetical protein NL676_022778 [Syzygium grande]|nr:hypothetical protein NL676_022778 [Syzygium grande]